MHLSGSQKIQKFLLNTVVCLNCPDRAEFGFFIGWEHCKLVILLVGYFLIDITTLGVGSASPQRPARRNGFVPCKGKVQPCTQGGAEMMLARDQDTTPRNHCWLSPDIEHPCGLFLGVLSRYMEFYSISSLKQIR